MLSLEKLESLGIQPPQEYARLYEVGLENLEPWRWVTDDRLKFRMTGFKVRYPDRILVPFAERQDCDDVACWEVGHPGGVIIIHDFAGKGFEVRATFGTFREWIHQALDDCLDFI